MTTKVSTFIHCVREDRRPAVVVELAAGSSTWTTTATVNSAITQRGDALRQPVAQAVVGADDEATRNRTRCSWRAQKNSLKPSAQRDDAC